MAEKRMFSKQVLWSDKFIDLPSPAQVLYFQLSMYADDEGFVNCAGYVRRLTGCSEGDIESLCKNGFIIPFESGVYAIAHWKINNNIRSDRMKKTSFSDERDMLYVRADGMYILDPEKAAEQRKSAGQEKATTTKCSQASDICPSDDGTGKESSDKDSTVKSSFDEEVDQIYNIYKKITKNPKILRIELKEWYDGYRAAAGDYLYNPRSVVCALRDNQLANYWTSSGTYDSIFNYIKGNIADVRNDIVLMVAGERVPAKMQQYAATANDLYTKDQIYSAMVVYGLLTYEELPIEIPRKNWRNFSI